MGLIATLEGLWILESRMTLSTGGIGPHADLELTSPVLIVVHRVARQAGKFTAREAWRREKSVIVAPRRPNHAWWTALSSRAPRYVDVQGRRGCHE